MRPRFSSHLFVIGIGLFLATMPVVAHHAFTAEFDANRPVTIKGKVVKMDWVNPHSWLYVDVKDAKGKVVTWELEFASPNALYRRGWRRDMLPVGTEVTIRGYMSKAFDNQANAAEVILPDGKKLFAGSSGTGAPVEPPK